MVDNYVEQLLTLTELVGEIGGRKKFQKMVYILQSKGVEFREKFKYHYFGPYSSDLQLEIDELVDQNKLQEDVKGMAYSYKVSSSVSFEKVNNIVQKKDLIKLMNNADASVLELTSTIYFLIRNGYDEESITNRLRNLKPHLDEHIDEAFELKNKVDMLV